MKFIVRIESQEKTVNIEERNGYYDVEIDGKKSTVDCKHFGHKDYLSLLIDNKSYLIESAPLQIDEGRYYASVMGRYYDVEVLDELLVATRKAETIVKTSGDYALLSPMPGLIIDIKAKVGDAIEAGSVVVIMEAMKMQNELVSEASGVVKEIHVTDRQSV
ncbi:MAG: biotin/lipoyl-containing protein, partial [Candidatus Latescibacterota bacterium]